MQRLMIAGTNSGCGKTTISCAVMQALVNRRMRVSAFKCGPDYIDPMFHESVIGADPHNLDAWFCEGKMLRRILTDGSSDSDISLIEGVMGFYDGVCGKLEKLVVKPSQILGNIHRLNAERLVIQTPLCFQNYQIVTGM